MQRILSMTKLLSTKKLQSSWLQQIKLGGLTALFLVAVLLFSYPAIALATEPIADDSDDTTPMTSEEATGIQAFWDFFGADGVNDCLEPDNTQDLIPTIQQPLADSDQQAVLTTAWENVGGGRINRKYLNGLVAFCFDEELTFPSGAVYHYTSASDATIQGQVAAIAQRYGKSGEDNAQWWSECQVAIWAVRAGCRSHDSAAAFARSYCADRKITDPATVEDYAYIVGALVEETADATDTAYLYQAADPANQRILTCLAVWPDPAPSSPSPKYDQVSATEGCEAIRRHSISLNHKSAAITGEALVGAVFTVYEDSSIVGNITTDAQGQGFCQWQLSETASATVIKEYCSNYDKLDPETRKTITGYTNREDAYTAAREDALAQAQTQANELADRSRTVTIKETTVPNGFSVIIHDSQTAPLAEILLTGDDHATFSAVNAPWSATLLIQKADGITGEIIPADATFVLYEWNGSDYEVTPHYQIIRQDDGVYTVDSSYPDGKPGQLYYTQQNQGKFALAEISAPEGYLLDPEWFFFEITKDEQTIFAHNAAPERYPICDDTKFANQAVTGTIQITKTGDYLTDVELPTSSGDLLIPDTLSIPQHQTICKYTPLPVSNASFSIYAAEDILSPGNSHQIAVYQGTFLYKDTLITTITTDACGIARLEGLPLGTYKIHETSAGNGDFLLDPTVITVSLTYKDHFTSIIMDDSTYYHNQHQRISLQLTKKNRPLKDVLAQYLSPTSAIPETLSTDILTSQVPLPGAIYGLYAAEDIYGYYWDETLSSVTTTPHPLIFAHTLIECVTTDTHGQAVFQSELPCGKYYVRELTPPAGYLPSDEIHTVDACYTGQNGEPLLSFSHTFYNDPVCLVVEKLDSKTQTPLAGANLSLWRCLNTNESDQKEWALVASWTSEEVPKLLQALLPGQYRLTEEQAPQGYHQTGSIEFVIKENTPFTTITLENTPIPPQEPKVPSALGAPTGDDNPLALTFFQLTGSILLIIPVAGHLLRKKHRVQ